MTMEINAIVAFKNSRRDSYDLYWSPRGGEGYKLQTGIEVIRDEEKITLTPDQLSKIPDIPYEPEDRKDYFGSREHLNAPKTIHEDPIKTDCAPQEIFSSINPYETDVCYLVDSNSVKTYLPLGVSPAMITHELSQLDVELYRFNTVDQLHYLHDNHAIVDGHQVDSVENITPDNLPEWAIAGYSTLNGYGTARYCQQRMNEFGHAFVATNGTAIKYQPRESFPIQPVPPEYNIALPIRITINNGISNYPQELEHVDRVAEPKDAAARLRVEAAKQGYPKDYVVEKLQEQFGDDIETKLVPGELQETV